MSGPAADRARIRLTVAHGHLAFARHPVLVGHYEGDTFAGSEAQLDRALGFRLTERRRLGLYPGPFGSVTVVVDPAARPCGAVVVGLGQSASLSMGPLRQTLRHGLLAFAAAEEDRRRAADRPAGARQKAEPIPLGLSVLAVGTGDGGLAVANGVIALLRAAAEAQAVLTSTETAGPAAGAAVWAGFQEIEFVEVIQDRALAIWHAAAKAVETQPEFGRVFELAPRIETRPGRRRRGAPGRDNGWWLPITIRMTGESRDDRNLVFEVADGLARAETQAVPADLDLVEPLVARAIGDVDVPGAPASAGRVLFEMLLPQSLKDRSAEERNRRLILDERSARFPWELLDDRRPWIVDRDAGDQRPFAVRAGLVRQLAQARGREPVRLRHGHRALVIGDPRGLPTEGFARLPSAESEAKAVHKLLRETGFTAKVLVGDGVMPDQVCRQLFAEAWEIVHIAAHGVVNEALPGPDGAKRVVTGVVLGGGVVLGPSVLSKLPVCPSIVFVNCCHLGKVDPLAEDRARQATAAGRPEFAAGVAVELIRSGVSCVVAAGWAVDDDAAEAFALRFYKEMLDGADFGSATLAARRAAYALRPDGNTWGAYQCYGDPDFRLSDFLPPAAGATASAPSFALVDEAIEAAQQVSEEANIGLERDPSQPIGRFLDGQRKRLAAVAAEAERKGWLSDADLRFALADAHAQLGDLADAIGHYAAAVAEPNARGRVRAVEQLANLQVRQACTEARKRPIDRDVLADAVRVVAEAETRLVGLTQALGETAERLALQGGCAKRLAQLLALGPPSPREGTDVEHELRRMAELYDRAIALQRARPGPGQDHRYPQLMLCSAGLCLALRAGHPVDSEVIALLKELRGSVAPDADDFWQLIASADAALMAAMAGLDAEAASWGDIVERYHRSWRHVGSPVKLMSVSEQLEFYEDVLGAASGMAEAARAALLARLAEVRRELQDAASGMASG
ncbi:CHAT domain-containing protein [Falsiroseomonas sp. HC035]|uniref:CHAT domain-containing protein n=1 Tax=Falsiroseomonas sp. HC035 TaxID=3390999 RepID=UPI003D31D29C